MQILVLEINTSITLFNLSGQEGSLKFENLGELEDSNQLNWTKNWNLGENGSYANHKITEAKKVNNENHNEIIRINL